MPKPAGTGDNGTRSWSEIGKRVGLTGQHAQRLHDQALRKLRVEVERLISDYERGARDAASVRRAG